MNGSPYEKNLAFEMIAQARGGTPAITGERDGRPHAVAEWPEQIARRS
jgi:crotonobetainyl-CoA:carnitine CoA-transferase CaiB-like acyl-CoA transferase